MSTGNANRNAEPPTGRWGLPRGDAFTIELGSNRQPYFRRESDGQNLGPCPLDQALADARARGLIDTGKAARA